MAYSDHKHAGGTITKFWPDDTSTELFIESDRVYSLGELQNKAMRHFGDVTLNELLVTAEYIHTDCLYYDQYDSSDYTKFIKITKT
jgi:hypothetical protein